MNWWNLIYNFMDVQIIYEKIKRARELRLFTNCYAIDLAKNADQLWIKEEDFIFSYKDQGISRLIFFAKDWHAVDELLKLVDRGRYYLEFMTKNPDERVASCLTLIARMMRLSNPDCSFVFAEESSVMQYMNENVGETAQEEDAEEINRVLWETFRTEISHLLSDEEIRDKITEGQITIHRDNHIDAILQADVRPKKFYINQIVNKTDRNIIHAILLNRLNTYVKNGGKYLYAWVEDTNIASLKFHEKYGMKHDGMWSMIYCLNRQR